MTAWPLALLLVLVLLPIFTVFVSLPATDGPFSKTWLWAAVGFEGLLGLLLCTLEVAAPKDDYSNGVVCLSNRAPAGLLLVLSLILLATPTLVIVPAGWLRKEDRRPWLRLWVIVAALLFALLVGGWVFAHTVFCDPT